MDDIIQNKVHQDVIFGQQAHEGLLKGAEILYKAVSSTLGPSGKCVIIDTPAGTPIITKDGITVAKSINLKEPLHKIGSNLLKDVSNSTNEKSGDGSTTAVVLGFNVLKYGIKMISSGYSAIGMKRGMDFASNKIIEILKKNSIAIRNKQDIVNIGRISANGDKQIGELLADAIEKVGTDGIITVEPAKSVHTTLEIVEGLQFDNGYVSPYFITNQEKLCAELNNPYIFITNRKISSLQEIVGILEMVAKNNRSLLIIGDEIEGEALHTLIVNKMKGILNVCAIKAPSYGDNRIDILNDIGIVCNGYVFDSSSGISLKKAEISQLGTCKKVIINRNSTTIIGDNSNIQIKEKIKERVDTIRTALSENNMDDLRRDKLRKRLAKLSGGIAVIKVGGSTEIEILEKKDRIEDALNATVAATQEGIVPGGGTALFYAANELENYLSEQLPQNSKLNEDEQAGIQVIISTCKTPLRTIVENTGKSADVVMEKLSASSSNTRFGYDASTESYVDMIDKGVIDPLKVPRLALENAVSVIGLSLCCNAVIINKEEME